MDPAVLQPHVDRLKDWVLSEEGFGEYLREFFSENKEYFNEYQEEHLHEYKALHSSFSKRFEDEINGFLQDEGLTEENLESMLRLGRDAGDDEMKAVVDTMLAVMEYEQWIKNIFILKSRIRERRKVVAARK